MRYAIYFTPPADDPLTRLASHWLGRDAHAGADVAQPAVAGLAPDRLSALTADPARYGFHATMKAPFSLAEGVGEDELVAALAAFAASEAAFTLPSLVLGQLGPFFALVPAAPSPALDDLAAACVTQFEPFRAPLSPHDMARRQPERLSAGERDNLLRWGYPYVLDAFRFHMTLTGPVERADQSSVRAAIEAHFDGLLGAPRRIDTLSIFVEPTRGAPFSVLTTAALAGNPSGKTA